MSAANSFDLWKKDAFFSAAEEVQASADIVESTYRRWASESGKRIKTQELDGLLTELQTALSLAKWQLEEFEKAVRLSHRNHAGDITTMRHRQFVAAIGGQISRIEATLRDYLIEERQQPLRWVSLDDKDRDDLAAFLSGVAGTSQGVKVKLPSIRLRDNKSVSETTNSESDSTKTISGRCTSNDADRDASHATDLDTRKNPSAWDSIGCQGDTNLSEKRIPDNGSINIEIPDEDEHKKLLMPNNEFVPLQTKFSATLRKPKSRLHLQLRSTNFRVINKINQVFSSVARSRRKLKIFRFSIQYRLLMMILIFLTVP